MNAHLTIRDEQARVLVVDDDPLVRDVAVMMLEGEGFDVLAADSAQEALRILKRTGEPPTVLFTDVRMPGPIDGMKLAEIVHLSWPEVMILVTSGDHRPSPDELPPTASFMAKPWRVDEVVSTVRALAGATSEGGRREARA